MSKIYLLIIAVLLFATTAYSQPWPLTAKLETSDQQSDDNHGYSVAISGDYAICGAYHEDHDGTGGSMLSNAGSAYIYMYDTTTKMWTQQAKIVAADRSASAFFGYSVDISGSYVIVGAPQDSSNSGAAYIYERSGTTWTQVKKVVATSRRANDRLGTSVAISGDWALVGAHHEDEDALDMNAANNAGSAFFYYRGTGSWDSVQKVVASDRNVNDEFGISVGIDGTKAIIGAYRYDGDTATQETGAAYAFALAGGTGLWTEQQILKAPDRKSDDEYGWSVDVSGNYYIIGAPRQDYDTAGGNFSINAGAAYIADDASSWAQFKVVAPDRADQDNYGQSVSISGDWAVIGAPLQNFGPLGQTPPNPLSDAGAAYLVKKSSTAVWTKEKKLTVTLTDRFAADKMGWSVDIDGNAVITGAPEDNVDGSIAIPSTGSAYVYRSDTATVSVQAIVHGTNAEVYPNPTTGVVNIQLDQKVKELEVRVYDLLGHLISEKRITDTGFAQFDLKQLPEGVYMLRLNTDGQQQEFRVVKY